MKSFFVLTRLVFALFSPGLPPFGVLDRQVTTLKMAPFMLDR